MQVVIPMSGEGSRFRRAGYDLPKPLIHVDGVPMIEHVVRMFPGQTDFLFICSSAHLRETPLRSVLERIAPAGRIVGIEPHKRGPVHAVLMAAQHIRDDQPVIVNYCDFAFVWDYDDFQLQMKETACSGCIAAYRGFHPHSLGPNLYAYLRHVNNFLIDIQEKHCFTDNRMGEYASSGTYYFRSGGLAKHYFQKAVQRGLETNGEFYASMPYNLLVEDGLNVSVYELTRFLQWGTPEDLEEYQRWSDYFAYFSEWVPQAAPVSGATLIPMAGDGVRFARENYPQPKPAIPVAGIPMIERALRALPPSEESIAVCRESQTSQAPLTAALRRASPGCRTLILSRPTEGQACTCLAARDQINPEEPLLVAPCDAATVYNEDVWQALLEDPATDCAVWTFRNHPHANRNPRQYGWVKLDDEGRVCGISCKRPLHESVKLDHGIIGIFWFRKARFLWEAADELIRRNLRIHNEFYIDSALEMLLEQGRGVRAFPVDYYICFGTPDDVRTFEYWENHFRKSDYHPYAKREGRYERQTHTAVHRTASL